MVGNKEFKEARKIKEQEVGCESVPYYINNGSLNSCKSITDGNWGLNFKKKRRYSRFIKILDVCLEKASRLAYN